MRRAAAATAAVLLSACAGNAPSGPPALRLGVDVCAGCGMTISDARYAAAASGDLDGERRVLTFDDIGCLARWDVKRPGFVPIGRWVHDRSTARWIDASAASFARSSAWATPMGSGLAAFARPDDAGEEALNWDRVRAMASRGDLDAPVTPTSREEPR